jgi:hypothetical protein
MPNATRRIARFAAVSATLLTVLGGVAQAASADASRAGAATPSAAAPTPTQTVLTASSDSVGTGGSVKITATVYPGIFVTPSGGVTFKDTTTHVRLGMVKPGKKCLLRREPCRMSITVHANRLKQGANTITGSFSGDISETPSSGSIVITRGNANPTVTTTCAPDSPECVTPTDDSDDGTAAASIGTFEPNGQTETISVSFQTTELPCSTPATGDPLVFSSTNAPSEKFVTYSVFGTAADIANQAYGSAGNICFGSPEPFVTKGFAPPVLGPDGLLYGLLPDCNPNDVVPPCIESASFQPGGEGDGPSEDEYTENVVVTAADPRMSN